jgi:hypothetical protein
MANTLRLNTLMSFALQVTTVICGFIVPWLILQNYGSDVNGVVSSINQFLQVIALLELGVGAVIQTAFYKPLAYKDNESISAIYKSGSKFFRKIALILTVYVIVLIAIYPLMVANSFDNLYTVTLIAAMSISYFAQYYFGILDRLLLVADQKGYVQYIAQIITLVLNTVACAVFIYLGASIQIVKLVTSLLFLLRPFVLHVYVKRHYEIDNSVIYEKEPIEQKWNGVAQHLSSLVIDYSSIIILTVLSTLSNVSIFAVYNLIVFGLRQLIVSLTEGMRAYMGELWVTDSIDSLIEKFASYEWALHTVSTGAFSCAFALAIPFVEVYTSGVIDVDYNQPVFSALLILSGLLYCYRLPYNTLVLIAGHYKQTQWNYIVSAFVSLFVSSICASLIGLPGVCIGLIISMIFQLGYLIRYQRAHILGWPLKKVMKQFGIDTVTIAAFICTAMFVNSAIPFSIDSFVIWVLIAFVDVLIWLVIALIVNGVFYSSNMKSLLHFGNK